MDNTLQRWEFYRGLLHPLHQHCDFFPTLPVSHFHQAFGEMLRVAVENLPSQKFEFLSSIQPDPIFGAYHEAKEMLLVAQDDRILDLVSGRAYFRASKEEDKEEHEALPHQEWFAKLALVFHIALERTPVAIQ